MKSIIQEAGSVAKAVEQGWEKAGKPQSFSIKVLELEEKNFLGMVKKPAKIAFFFEEVTTKFVETKKKKIAKPIKTLLRQAHADTGAMARRQDERIKEKPKSQPRKKEVAPKEVKPKKTVRKTQWSNQMVSFAETWTQDMLRMMKLSHIKYTMRTTSNNIKFHFEAPLLKDQKDQKILFSSFALLVMQSLRNKHKKQFKNLNAVFTTE